MTQAHIRNMIRAVTSEKPADFKSSFMPAMADKIMDKLEDVRIEVASNLFKSKETNEVPNSSSENNSNTQGSQAAA